MKIKNFVSQNVARLNAGRDSAAVQQASTVLEKPITAKRLDKMRAIAATLNAIVIYDKGYDLIVFVKTAQPEPSA